MSKSLARGFNQLNKKLLLASAVAAAVMASALPASAAITYTWTNGTAGTQDWNTVGNWSGGTVDSAPGTNTDILTFFANTTTALSAGNDVITTNVPTALTFNVLTLNGLGAASGSATNVTIGASADTWTLDGTTPTVNLNGLVGAMGLNL